MKVYKWLAALIAFAVAACGLPFAPSPVQAQADIAIQLDGQLLKSDVPPYIIPKVNLTVVPLRVIGEGLGAAVDWNSAAKTVTISRPDSAISMKLGQSYATVNGDSVSLDASVLVRQDRVMVPIRFVGEEMGLQVNWDPNTRLISLLNGGLAVPTEPGPGIGDDGGAASGDGAPSGDVPSSDGGTGSGTGADDGAAPGTGPATEPGADPSNGGSPKPGLRGAWISTVGNLDWPSPASLADSDKQRAEFTTLLDKLQAMGMNAVFVQVRPAADAFYPSSLVPWSKYLTGTSGKAPDYDPLAFMIGETHKRGMEFHAWFNPFRASTDTSTAKLDGNSVVKQHPEWIVTSGGKFYINPGIPEARQHIIDAIMEVVNGYDIDGVHLDDYFYPTDGPFGDDVTFRTYNANHIATLGDWRRDNINDFIRTLGQSVHLAKPQAAFGVSPFGVWRNKAADATGSDTRAGVTSYDNMYADVRTWIKQGWIDYVIPQIYWSLSFSAARYDTLADWWASEVRGTDVKLYIGHSPYKIGTPEAGWQSAEEIVNQLRYNEQLPDISGDVFFSAKDLLRNPLGLIPKLQSYYGVRP